MSGGGDGDRDVQRLERGTAVAAKRGGGGQWGEKEERVQQNATSAV